MTPQQWAEKLDLGYDMSIVYFDEKGKEVFRHDAETGHFRMNTSMSYVLAKGYLEEGHIQRWVRKKKIEQMQTAKK